MSMKNFNDTIGNRTHDLSACSAVPQITAPPRTPLHRGRRIIVQRDTRSVQEKWVTNVGSTPVSLQWVTTLDVFKMFGRILGVSSPHTNKQKFVTTALARFLRFCPTICWSQFLNAYVGEHLKILGCSPSIKEKQTLHKRSVHVCHIIATASARWKFATVHGLTCQCAHCFRWTFFSLFV